MITGRIAAILFTLLAAASDAARQSNTSPKSEPGFCKEPKDCKVDGYECVALQTTRTGAEEVKQCVPTSESSPVCSGKTPGLCPTFSSWITPYKQISSLCTYKPAKKCAPNPSGPSVRGQIICVPEAKDEDGEDLKVIYGCVDVDLVERRLGFIDDEAASKLARELDTVDTVIKACLDPNATNTSATLLCGGHGTCLPTGSASLKYECRCNVGYSGDYCDKKDSNKCALPGQCSAGECNLEKQVCECPAGTEGNQCADCDASSPKACNSNGKCVNKQCVCDSDFLGDHCDVKVTEPPAKKQRVKSQVKEKKEETAAPVAANAAQVMPAASALAWLLAVSVIVMH